jgi:hypothetical protein
LLSDNSVENGEELSGDGDDCDQLWFSGVERRAATRAPMKRAARTCVLPPPMKLLPFHCPD